MGLDISHARECVGLGSITQLLPIHNEHLENSGGSRQVSLGLYVSQATDFTIHQPICVCGTREAALFRTVPNMPF